MTRTRWELLLRSRRRSGSTWSGRRGLGEELTTSQRFMRCVLRVLRDLVRSREEPRETSVFVGRRSSLHHPAMIDNVVDVVPGIVAGRYKVLNQIGRGGMGVVYAAEDVKTGE